MPDPKAIAAAVDAYLAAITAHDAEAVVALFAPDATVEDPVGSDVHQGADALLAFYQRAVSAPITAERTGPVRVAGSQAAFPFTVTVGTQLRLHVIDVMGFDTEGRIASMRAFWGPGNMEAL